MGFEPGYKRQLSEKVCAFCGSHGNIATASVVVNSIPAILDAHAGLRGR